MMRKISFKKKSLVSFSMIIAMGSFLFYAYEDGITGKTLKSSEPGCLCHSETQSSEVTVLINGPDDLASGQTAAYSITISGGSLIRGGTNIAASAGNLQPGDGLQKISGELTHIFPRLPQDNEVVFDFYYTAPTVPTTITLYANGNSVNFSGTEIGDTWNFAENKTITINTVADLKDDFEEKNFSLAQNFPNPFNPTTSIQYSVSRREFVSLKVYDVTANEVAVLVSEEKEPGVYVAEFDAGSLSGEISTKDGYSSGVYFYTLKIENSIVSRKMLLLK